ncbi:lipid droplet-associated hydrolase-like [Gracilinanus agilis]|uniref:lipid droplet-associated hydrolase-like n=1 Tax=Gracilinanus agilis TaxID=191870 RepID=UPI001CFCE47C|nr:lipid droplet-associated hydrolase-like [Gracilinanus agilis]
MYLGSQEMRTVLERDNGTIQKNLKKLTFYYGASDLWCPVQYYEDIKKDFPSGDIRLCKKGIQHAFVTSLTSSREMAAMIRDWLKDDLAEM